MAQSKPTDIYKKLPYDEPQFEKQQITQYGLSQEYQNALVQEKIHYELYKKWFKREDAYEKLQKKIKAATNLTSRELKYWVSVNMKLFDEEV